MRRRTQTELDAGLTQVTSFEIADNGIGVNDTQRNSFDTLYTDLKITEGGWQVQDPRGSKDFDF